MTMLALAGLMISGLAQASDLEKYPPGAKPFHTPKSPQPVGVLTNCYGYHPTNWTPWQVACTEPAGNCAPAVTAQPSSKTIILYDRAPEANVPASDKAQPMPKPAPK
jgi:hypothetical protein